MMNFVKFCRGFSAGATPASASTEGQSHMQKKGRDFAVIDSAVSAVISSFQDVSGWKLREM
jgi:hypothetical protein